MVIMEKRGSSIERQVFEKKLSVAIEEFGLTYPCLLKDSAVDLYKLYCFARVLKCKSNGDASYTSNVDGWRTVARELGFKGDMNAVVLSKIYKRYIEECYEKSSSESTSNLSPISFKTHSPMQQKPQKRVYKRRKSLAQVQPKEFSSSETTPYKKVCTRYPSNLPIPNLNATTKRTYKRKEVNIHKKVLLKERPSPNLWENFVKDENKKLLTISSPHPPLKNEICHEAPLEAETRDGRAETDTLKVVSSSEIVIENRGLPKPSGPPEGYNIEPIIRQLECGLPHEVQFGLNSLLVLTETWCLPLPKYPRLLGAILANTGILGTISSEYWSDEKIVNFWEDSQQENSFFNNGYDSEKTRSTQVSVILFNLCHVPTNCTVLLNSPSFMSYLMQSLQCRILAIRNNSVGMLSLLTKELKVDESPFQSEYVMKKVMGFIVSPDHFLILSGLEFLSGLCQKADNHEFLLRHIKGAHYSRLAQLLLVPDVQLLHAVLDSLYEITSIGTEACDKLLTIPHFLNVILKLLRVSAYQISHRNLKVVNLVKTKKEHKNLLNSVEIAQENENTTLIDELKGKMCDSEKHHENENDEKDWDYSAKDNVVGNSEDEKGDFQEQETLSESTAALKDDSNLTSVKPKKISLFNRIGSSKVPPLGSDPYDFVTEQSHKDKENASFSNNEATAKVVLAEIIEEEMDVDPEIIEELEGNKSNENLENSMLPPISEHSIFTSYRHKQSCEFKKYKKTLTLDLSTTPEKRARLEGYASSDASKSPGYDDIEERPSSPIFEQTASPTFNLQSSRPRIEPNDSNRGDSPTFDREASPTFDRGGSPTFGKGASPKFDNEGSQTFDRGGSPTFDKGGSPIFDKGASPNFNDTSVSRVDEKSPLLVVGDLPQAENHGVVNVANLDVDQTPEVELNSPKLKIDSDILVSRSELCSLTPSPQVKTKHNVSVDTSALEYKPVPKTVVSNFASSNDGSNSEHIEEQDPRIVSVQPAMSNGSPPKALVSTSTNCRILPRIDLQQQQGQITGQHTIVVSVSQPPVIVNNNPQQMILVSNVPPSNVIMSSPYQAGNASHIIPVSQQVSSGAGQVILIPQSSPQKILKPLNSVLFMPNSNQPAVTPKQNVVILPHESPPMIKQPVILLPKQQPVSSDLVILPSSSPQQVVMVPQSQILKPVIFPIASQNNQAVNPLLITPQTMISPKKPVLLVTSPPKSVNSPQRVLLVPQPPPCTLLPVQSGIVQTHNILVSNPAPTPFLAPIASSSKTIILSSVNRDVVFSSVSMQMQNGSSPNTLILPSSLILTPSVNNSVITSCTNVYSEPVVCATSSTTKCSLTHSPIKSRTDKPAVSHSSTMSKSSRIPLLNDSAFESDNEVPDEPPPEPEETPIWTDDPECPVTRSLRLLAGLILRNLVRHRPNLSGIVETCAMNAMSSLEVNKVMADCLAFTCDSSHYEPSSQVDENQLEVKKQPCYIDL